MESTPNYSNYSLPQLLDIEQHIDKENFPERYTVLLAEIDRQKQLQTQSLKLREEKTERLLNFLTSHLVVLVSTLSGLWLARYPLLTIYLTLWPEAGTRNDLAPWLSIFMGFIWLIPFLPLFIPVMLLLIRSRNHSFNESTY